MPLLYQANSAVNNARFGYGTCTPTASAMVMEAVFSVRKDVIAGSFAESLYQQGAYGVVNLLAEDMGTTPNAGTYSDAALKTFSKIATGLSEKSEGFAIWNSRTKTVDLATVNAQMKTGSAGIISFGMFIPQCSTLASGRTSCSFQRDNGHSIAVQAAAADKLQIFDPNQLKWTTSLALVKSDARFADATLALSSNFSETTARIVTNNYGNYTNVGIAEVYMGVRKIASVDVPVVTTPAPAPTQPTTPTEPTTPAPPKAEPPKQDVPTPPATPKPSAPKGDVVVVAPKQKIDWEWLKKYYIQKGWLQVKR
jgi:hypothetical protein